jgi:hypothetical protein
MAGRLGIWLDGATDIEEVEVDESAPAFSCARQAFKQPLWTPAALNAYGGAFLVASQCLL